MLSYVVGLVAFLIFFLNPISQLLWPQTRRVRTERPQLDESLLALDTPNETFAALDCPDDAYLVHVFSKFPLVLYIENFLSADEREHLLEIRYVPGSMLMLTLSLPAFISHRPPHPPKPTNLTTPHQSTYSCPPTTLFSFIRSPSFQVHDNSSRPLAMYDTHS